MFRAWCGRYAYAVRVSTHNDESAFDNVRGTGGKLTMEWEESTQREKGSGFTKAGAVFFIILTFLVLACYLAIFFNPHPRYVKDCFGARAPRNDIYNVSLFG